MHLVGAALLGVAFLCSPQRAEAGWHESLGKDLEDEGIRGGLPTAAPVSAYTQASPLGNLDETITYLGSEWFARQDTLGKEVDITSVDARYYFQPLHDSSQIGRSGSSLISLAKVLQGAKPQLRLALMRQFCLSLARLRTRLLGISSQGKKFDKKMRKKKKRSEKYDKEWQDATERHIAALSAKLAGVLGAAESSAQPGKTLAKYLLMAFVKLVQEVEGLLLNVAMRGDAAMMITALNQLAPPIVRGLAHLEDPESQGAAEALEPARDHLIERARELDNALLTAQEDLDGVLREFPRDFDEHEIEREKQIAALEGGPSQEQYLLSLRGEGHEAVAHEEKLRRQARMALLLSLLLTISTMVTAVAIAAPVSSGEVRSRRGNIMMHRRRRRGIDAGNSSRDSGSSGGQPGTGQGTPNEANGHRGLQDAAERHRRWILDQRRAAAHAFSERNPVGEREMGGGAVSQPSAPQPGGHSIREPVSPSAPPLPQPPSMDSAPSQPSAPPLGPPFLRIPPRSPPPSYEEAIRGDADFLYLALLSGAGWKGTTWRFSGIYWIAEFSLRAFGASKAFFPSFERYRGALSFVTVNRIVFPMPLMLHDSYDKLIFVCQGYIDRLSIDKLPPALQQQLKEIRESPVPLYDGRLPWSDDLQKAIRRTAVPCLAFATGRTHHLLEVFTMDEVLAFERLIPEIRKGFAVTLYKWKRERLLVEREQLGAVPHGKAAAPLEYIYSEGKRDISEPAGYLSSEAQPAALSPPAPLPAIRR
ncbi:hypothetical protein, conserved [Eimeria praecox]|uniref:Uncharacterized protein n=1 Tax=Eimeria praecox TaxID=51316 RepID=U6H5L3_9EIME|nr:hypothetical protein, conserved [Eimeria praecox]